MQGAKKANFTACLNSIVACASLKVISTSPPPPPPPKKKNFDTHYIDYCSSLMKILQKEFHFPIGRVNNRIH